MTVTSVSSLEERRLTCRVNSYWVWRASCILTRVVCLSFSDEQEAVQKRTFTKWINSHLAKVSVEFHPCTPLLTYHIAIDEGFRAVGLEESRLLQALP